MELQTLPKCQDKKAQLGRMLLSQAGNQAVRAKSMAELGCENGGFQATQSEGHGRAGMEAQRFQGMAAMGQVQVEFSYI